MDKFKFEFAVKQSEDPKTNVICITSITNADKNVFSFPEQLQPVKMHDVVLKTQAFLKVKSTLQRRYEKRQVWISVTPEIRDAYLDEDGNMQFKGYLLEEITSTLKHQACTQERDDLKKESKQPNLRKLSEKFVIEKFTKKSSSVMQWMVIFEAECTRIGINEDIQKIQIFRLFLDDSCQDWYNSMLIKFTIDSEWRVWKENFCESFVNKGWTPIRYAILFKYKQGTLLEYALKKERLLLEINKFIDNHTLIDLIVTGLPNFIADEIDRETLKETKDLFKNIRGLEHLISKRSVDRKEMYSENKIRDKNFKTSPCKICEKEKKGTRYHSEATCWFKNKDNDRFRKEQIRSVNNSELELSLNEIDPKN